MDRVCIRLGATARNARWTFFRGKGSITAASCGQLACCTFRFLLISLFSSSESKHRFLFLGGLLLVAGVDSALLPRQSQVEESVELGHQWLFSSSSILKADGTRLA